MRQFTKEIDLKLNAFANKINAKVTRGRRGYPGPLRTFEERRIDWVDEKINKAIVFQPNFELKIVNDEKWNFRIVAWYFEGPIDLRFLEELVREKQFDFIVNQLDQLLGLAVERLSKINMIELEKLNSER